MTGTLHANGNYYFDDGWTVIDPLGKGLLDAEWRARHQPEKLTAGDISRLASAASAYRHFAAETTDTTAQLRELRRAVKANTKKPILPPTPGVANGETVGEHSIPRILTAYQTGKMPPLLPGYDPPRTP